MYYKLIVTLKSLLDHARLSKLSQTGKKLRRLKKVSEGWKQGWKEEASKERLERPRKGKKAGQEN